MLPHTALHFELVPVKGLMKIEITTPILQKEANIILTFSTIKWPLKRKSEVKVAAAGHFIGFGVCLTVGDFMQIWLFFNKQPS